jgi:tRNA dimethylallyltransferase
LREHKSDYVLILGVTASGKGRLAFTLAKSLGAEIISIDSMKVYRRMDIGTAKPPKDARRQVKYHLIDIVEPSDSFSVGAFLDSAYEAIKNIKRRNRASTLREPNIPIIAVGGTALYIKAILYGLFEGPSADFSIRAELREQAQAEGLEKLYLQLVEADPAAAQRIHPNDSKRIIRALEVYKITGKPISSLQQQFKAEKTLHNWTVIGLQRQKTDVSSRINKRTKKMIEAGFVDEVKSLLAEEKPLSQQARCAIGYAEMIDYLGGKITLEEATELIKKNTRRLAKNQRTWFKTFKNVNWLDIEPKEPPEKIFERTEKLLKNIR